MRSAAPRNATAAGAGIAGGSAVSRFEPNRIDNSAVAPSSALVRDALSTTGEALPAQTRDAMEARISGALMPAAQSWGLRARQSFPQLKLEDEAAERQASSVADRATSDGSMAAATTPSGTQQRIHGLDFSAVRIHHDAPATASAKALRAKAYTFGHDIVFGAGEFNPQSRSGHWLLAHELAHVAQQREDRPRLQLYGDPIPIVAHPTVTTMVEFIDLVRRIEAAHPGQSALQIAQMIMRTKYHSQGFDYLLPSSAGGAQVTTSSGVSSGAASTTMARPRSSAPGVSAADVTTLSGEFDIDLPQGGRSDPSHIVTAITAGAETQAPGAGLAGGLSGLLIQALPTGLSSRDVATWVGDVASAAAEWETAHPLPHGGSTKENYLQEFAPESDLIGDIDGIAMTSRSASVGFAFDPSASLSSNLERFYFPTGAREGKNRRFHSFCAVEHLDLNTDGVTLSTAAINAIKNRVHLNTDWFSRNDPNLTTWLATQSEGLINPIRDAWIQRANDWQWFADRFIQFVQRNLSAEGP